MTRLQHYDDLSTPRFITFGSFRRYELLKHEFACRLFVEHLSRMRTEHRIRVFGWVLMPDHVHLVLHPPDGARMGEIIGKLKLFSARDILTEIEGRMPEILSQFQVRRDEVLKRSVWNRRCYDHNCRDRDAVLEKINYCHNNPVKRGLVREPGEWVWSSYGWYAGYREVLLEMDEIDAIPTLTGGPPENV